MHLKNCKTEQYDVLREEEKVLHGCEFKRERHN